MNDISLRLVAMKTGRDPAEFYRDMVEVGLSTRQIAERLEGCVSHATVRKHLLELGYKHVEHWVPAAA